jgi:ParB family chromosome partitioning protein
MDLFADAAEERGRVIDEGVLQQLVDDKIAILRAEVRATTARPDLRFVGDQPKDQWENVDYQLSVKAKPRAEGGIELPEGDVVAHIAIDASGAPIVSYWWASRKAKFGNEKPAAPIATVPPTPAPASKSAFDAHHRAEAEREGDGLTIDGTFAMSAVRKVVLRAALIDDAKNYGTVGLDYFVWAQARALFTTVSGQHHLGIRIIAGDSLTGVPHAALALAREHVAATEASRIAAKAMLTISQQDFFTDGDLEAAFMAYRSATPEMKSLTVATVAGFALERSLATPDLRCVVHDAIASEMDIYGVRFRQYWTPTGDMLDMLPKAQRLAIAEPFVDVPTLGAWAKAKSADLTTGVLALLTRAGSRGLRWVHPLLRFSVPYAALSTDDREAAE